MEGEGMSGMSARRGPRSIKQTLGSIILGFEMVVMFLGSLVIFGLKALPAPVALIGGAGYWLGWAVQAAIVATGLLVPMMFLVGGMAAAVWTYAMVQGDKIERQQAFYREAKD
jgi:hypothetical protein